MKDVFLKYVITFSALFLYFDFCITSENRYFNQPVWDAYIVTYRGKIAKENRSFR